MKNRFSSLQLRLHFTLPSTTLLTLTQFCEFSFLTSYPLLLMCTTVADGSPSILRFDWKTGKFYSASIKDTAEPVSFIVPASSSSNTLIAGLTPCVARLRWDGVSSTATKINNIACRNPVDLNGIDRGATSPDGTLYMSIIPSTHCNKTVASTFPDASIVYLKIGSGKTRIKNALTPGTYSNGIVFNSKTNTCYIADDCSGTIFAARWNPKTKSLSKILAEAFRSFVVRTTSLCRFI